MIPSTLQHRGSVLYGCGGFLCLVLAYGIAYRTQYVLLVIAVAGCMTLAAARPEWFVAALVASLLFPYAWSPSITGGPTPPMVLLAVPGALVAFCVVVARSSLRPNRIDVVVAALFGSVFLSELMTGHGHRLFLELAKAGLLPYLAFRLIFTAWPSALAKVPDALLWTGVALSLLAVLDVLIGSSPFIHGPVNPILSRWAIDIHRGGVIRASATLGHPIALGSFLVAPLVIAFAKENWRVFGFLAVGELLTFSRGPWIAAVLAILIYAWLAQGVQRLILIGVLILITGMFVGPVHHIVSASFQSGSVEQANASYRSQLIGTTLRTLSVWGTPAPMTQQSFLLSQLQPTDVTSELALVAAKQGVLGLLSWIGLLAAFSLIARDAARSHDKLLLGLAVALIGMWISMLSVALITTFAVAFWLIVAAVASQAEVGSPRSGGDHRVHERVPDASPLHA